MKRTDNVTPLPGAQIDTELAKAEETRATGLAGRIEEISADPAHPSRGSLPLYEDALKNALGNWRDAVNP